MDLGLLLFAASTVLSIAAWDRFQKRPKLVTLGELSDNPKQYQCQRIRISGEADYFGSFGWRGWGKEDTGRRILYQHQYLVYILHPGPETSGPPGQLWSKALVYSNKALDLNTEVKISGVWQRRFGDVPELARHTGQDKATVDTAFDSGYVLVIEE